MREYRSSLAAVVAILLLASCVALPPDSDTSSSFLDLTVEFPNFAFRMSGGRAIPTETLAVKFEHLNAAIQEKHPQIRTGPIFVSPRVAAFEVEGWEKQFDTCVPIAECSLGDFLDICVEWFNFAVLETDKGIIINFKDAPTR